MAFYKVHALVDIGYHSGEDSRVRVTNQLITFRSLGLGLDFYRKNCTSRDEYIRLWIREKALSKLSSSLMNYGVEGLKRWDPRVLSYHLEEHDYREVNDIPALVKDLPPGCLG